MMSTTEGELDIEVQLDREEGEIADSDVEDGTYIPLARPETFNPPSLVNMQIQDEQSDEASPAESSPSDSDDELRRRPKRTKLRLRNRQTQPQQEKKNKYNVWCTALQEDLLTEDMVGCDVTKNRRYGVESYDYTIKYRLEDEYNAKKLFTQTNDTSRGDESNKRSYSDRRNLKLRLGKKMNSNQRPKERQQPRVLADLTVTTEDSIDAVAKDIAEKLAEEKMELIVRIVTVLGSSKAIEIYKETQTIEADGGMLIMNGNRRRTPGGVFFFLTKRGDDITRDKVNQIFSEDKKETHRRIRQARVRSRQKVVEQLKQSLTDSELPSLLSRGEATIARTEHGSNPPPSPATDARDCSSDTDAHAHSPPHRPVQDYDDDDYLEVMCNDDMDLF